MQVIVCIQPVHVLLLAYRIHVAHILVTTDRKQRDCRKGSTGATTFTTVCPMKDTSLLLGGSAKILITNRLKII